MRSTDWYLILFIALLFGWVVFLAWLDARDGGGPEALDD